MTVDTHRTVQPRVLYFGTPVLLISTTNPDGTANLAPMSSAWWLDDRCLLGLSARSQTTINLRRTGELVLNLVDPALAGAVDRLAGSTGTEVVPESKQAKGYRFVADKFALAQLTPRDSVEVAAPRVAECPVQLEARVRDVHPIGDRSCLAIESQVLTTHVRSDLMLTGSDRYLDPDAWDPLIMKFTHLYGFGRNVRDSTLADLWQIPGAAG